MHPHIHIQQFLETAWSPVLSSKVVKALGKHLHLALENPKKTTDLTFRAGQGLGDEKRERLLKG